MFVVAVVLVASAVLVLFVEINVVIVVLIVGGCYLKLPWWQWCC